MAGFKIVKNENFTRNALHALKITAKNYQMEACFVESTLPTNLELVMKVGSWLPNSTVSLTSSLQNDTCFMAYIL